jgi:2'-5' RNA ligase
VAGDDRTRLFCALQLPEAVVASLARWQAAHITAGRLVPAEHLHVTLAFLGSRPRSELPGIVRELAGAAAGGGPVRLRVQRYRETSSVGMLVFEDRGGGGSALARALEAGLERIGSYRPEQRPWLPHVTVTRFRRPRVSTHPCRCSARSMPSGRRSTVRRCGPRGHATTYSNRWP